MPVKRFAIIYFSRPHILYLCAQRIRFLLFFRRFLQCVSYQFRYAQQYEQKACNLFFSIVEDQQLIFYDADEYRE